jgi:hypothetical protein
MNNTTPPDTDTIDATPIAIDPKAPPSSPGAWPLKQIEAALSRKLPPAMLETKKANGEILTFIPWYTACDVLDKYAPGWEWKITNTMITGDRLILTGSLTIPTANGPITRMATGTEMLKKEKFDEKTGVTRIVEIPYGDPSSNAESKAFRRCAAKFGLARYLYRN